jgi:Homeodomain-like domain
MPKQSPFSIELTRGEREELESRVRKYTSPYCDVIRAKIVLLAAQGFSNDVIAFRLDTPRQIVSKWRQRFCRARLPGLEEQPRGGRKARFSPQRRRSGEGPSL